MLVPLRPLVTPRRTLALLLVTAALAVNLLGCAKPPPDLTSQAQQAFYKTEALKGLDLLRDFAIAGEATTPKVLLTSTTRDVVETHRSIVLVMRAADAGWREAVATTLDELLARRTDSEKAKFQPYVALVKTLLKEIH